MNSSTCMPMTGFVDTAKPLPFQMRYARWMEGDGGDGGGDGAGEGQSGKGEQQGQEQVFKQADVDRIVADRLKREREKITARFSDYDDLKAKAEGAKTAEDRIAELEQKYQAEQTARLRSDIAAAHGISKEDRDLFLTGTDEDTLTKQAERLAAHVTERKKHGNRAPLQGRTPSKSAEDTEEREAARSLFGSGG